MTSIAGIPDWQGTSLVAADVLAGSQTLELLASRLSERVVRYELNRDRRCVFTFVYLRLTEMLGWAIRAGDFEDPAAVVRLADAFATEYFVALDAHDRGDTPPGPWKDVVATLRAGSTSPLEDLLLPLAAHVVYDLPHALETTWRSSPFDQSGIGDFHRVNDVLARAVDDIQREAARRYSCYLHWLDWLGQGDDEVLTDYGFRVARALAWYNATRLTDPRLRAHAEESIAHSVRIIIERVMVPSRFSLRFLLRVLRFVSGRFRRWPAVVST